MLDENFLSQNCNIFSVLSINVTQKTKQIINLLLFNNFYPMISTSSKGKRRIIVYVGHSLWSARTSCQRKRLSKRYCINNFNLNFLVPKLQYFFSVLSIFEYNPVKRNNKFINNFYSEILYLRVQKENDELLYTIWSLVMVRESVANASD